MEADLNPALLNVFSTKLKDGTEKESSLTESVKPAVNKRILENRVKRQKITNMLINGKNIKFYAYSEGKKWLHKNRDGGTS